MAFDPRTVFGLCNVLNRHADHINLNVSLARSSQHSIEQWAKRMDLKYRDSAANWQLILRNPAQIMDKLNSIETLSSDLISELYDVELGIQKQLSKGLQHGSFAKFRIALREQFDYLKSSLGEVKNSLESQFNLVISAESAAVIDAVIDVWKSSKKNKKLPTSLKTDAALRNFTVDSFQVFKVDIDPQKSYENWYMLNYR